MPFVFSKFIFRWSFDIFTRRYMVEILPIRRKKNLIQLINQSIHVQIYVYCMLCKQFVYLHIKIDADFVYIVSFSKLSYR